MNGRRIYHARGKVLGGSSSINGMIFQRGNPLDYERWAADPGMATWDYAHCLPYFKRMETCLAAAPDDPYRGHSGPLILERGPATNPLFGAFFDAAVQAGYARTDDVNGYRQEGFAAFDRNIRRGRRLSAARAYLHPVRKRPNLEVRTSAFVSRIVFDGRTRGRRRGRPGAWRAEHIRGRRGHPRRRGDQLAAAAPAVGRRRRDRAGRPRHRRRRTTCPASARISRTTSRSTSSTRHAAGLDAAGARRQVAPARGSGSSGCSSAAVRVRRTTSRAAASSGERRGRLPEPDVPFPAARDPLRRLAPVPAGTATRSTSGRCTRTPAAR